MHRYIYICSYIYAPIYIYIYIYINICSYICTYSPSRLTSSITLSSGGWLVASLSSESSLLILRCAGNTTQPFMQKSYFRTMGCFFFS